MSEHGGKRIGAGRPAGILNNKTRSIAEKAIEEGISPLEVMLDTMRQAHVAGDYETALEAAKSAAPYMHPRLSAVSHDVTAKIENVNPVMIFKLPDNGRDQGEEV